ncbi:MAG: hypothetical protein GY796_14315 [Chloroflexi bacterium]|nr:hypothetical protein [Chloroflexota bacterium]
MDFVARQMELNLLDDLYRRSGAQLLILYGRAATPISTGAASGSLGRHRRDTGLS